MTKTQSIEVVKKLVQVAGQKRLRSLFNKYQLASAPTVHSVIAAVKLYGMPFALDLEDIARDAAGQKVRYTDYGIPAGPTSSASDAPSGSSAYDWVMGILGALPGIGSGVASVWSSVNGNPYNPIVVQSNDANNPYANPYYYQQQQNNSNNTAIWVIVGIVVLALVGVGVALVLKKK